MRVLVAHNWTYYNNRIVDTYARSMIRDLRVRGHEVFETVKTSPPNNKIYKGIDLLLDVDCGRDTNGNLHWHGQEKKPPIPSAVYLIDSHGYPSLHRRIAKNYDHVFFAVWDKRDLFAKHNSATWLPNFTDRVWFDGADYPEEGTIDFGFFGCIAEHNKILMADGTYRTISKIIPGEFVLNKDGNPVKVLRVIDSGVKKVVKLTHKFSTESLYITADHRLFIGDCNSWKSSSLKSLGYSKCLEYPHLNGRSKLTWKSVSELTNKDVLTSPKTLTFTPKTFNINLTEYMKYPHKELSRYSTNVSRIRPNYALGYIIGTFLGDGYAKSTKLKGGYITWVFNKSETSIAANVAKFIEECFGKKCTVNQQLNTVTVTLYSAPLAKLFRGFYTKDKNKILPNHFMSTDTNYLRGLFEGLIDSDGHIRSDGTITFSNTSTYLIDLFVKLNWTLNKRPSAVYNRASRVSKINKRTIKSRSSFEVVCLNSDKRIHNNLLLTVKPKIESTMLNLRTFDLEVDDDTQSFICENVIVHNSKGGLGRAKPLVEIADKHGWSHEVRQVSVSEKHRWPQTAEAMAKCRFLFNHGQKKDLNLRIFESMCMSRPLICDRNERSGIDKLFEPWKHYIPYESHTYVGLEEAMEWCVRNPNKAKLIAEAAYQETLNKHLVRHRMDQILEVVNV